jgi:hypothetical protein
VRDTAIYALAKQQNGSWIVSSTTTAEGPDILTNIQNVRFADRTITLANS